MLIFNIIGFIFFVFPRHEAIGAAEENFLNETVGRSTFNPCFPNPCKNGGLCSIFDNSYVCICAVGYVPPNCDGGLKVIADSCSSSPCGNGGSCRPYASQPFTCDCLDTFYGPTCHETKVVGQKCYPNPCFNGGTCYENLNGYACACTSLYTELRCETKIQTISTVQCSPNPCLHGGVCTKLYPEHNSKEIVCICPQGYSGIKCEIFISQPSNKIIENVCDPNPCQGDCRCTPSCRHSDGYYCQSSSGYLGKDCTIPPPTLTCDPNVISVVVQDIFIKEYEYGLANAKMAISTNADAVGLLTASQSCLSTFDGFKHTFRLQLPFTECGTIVRLGSDGSTTFVNNIWLNRVLNGGFDMPVPVIRFECTYQKEYSIITKITPAQDLPLIVRQTGEKAIPGVMELCKIPFSCPSSCQAPFSLTQAAVYTVGEMIHLNIHGTNNDVKEIVSLKKLFLSCDGSTSSEPVLILANEACPTENVPTVVSHNGKSSSVCVSFKVPRLANCDKFYIHARLEKCPNGMCPWPTTCWAFGGRKRRSTNASVTTEIDNVFGPIHVINGSTGISKETLFRNNDVIEYRDHKTDKINLISNKEDDPVVMQNKLEPDTKDISRVDVSTAIMLVIVASFCLIVSIIVFVVVYTRACRCSSVFCKNT